MLARMGARAIPWLGLLYLGYELYQFWQQGRAYWGLRAAGYTRTHNCNRPKSYMSDASTTLCNGYTGYTSFAVAEFSFPPYPSLVGIWQGSPGVGNMKRPSERWSKIASPKPHVLLNPTPDPFNPAPHRPPQIDPEETPQVWPVPVPAPLPVPFIPLQPDFSPHSPEPIRGPQPVPVPVPVPYPWPTPFWPVPAPVPRPVPQPTRPGTRPNPSPTPAPVPSPGPAPVPVPVPPPNVAVPPSWELGPSGRPRPRPRPRNRPARAPKRTKERKVQGGWATGVVAVALSFVTESADFIEAFWWALPRQYRSPPRWDPWQEKWYAVGPTQQLRDLYDHWDHVDLDLAWDNLYAMMGEDAFYGILGQAMGKAGKAAWNAGYTPNGFSFGRGPAM